MGTTTKIGLQVYLFGGFRLYRNGALISSKDWHTRQARQLFKVLLSERGRIIPTHKLTELLWAEYAESAHKTLRSAINALRNVLEPERDPWLPSRFVPRGRDGYTLTFPPDCSLWIDVAEFEQLLDSTLTGPNTARTRAKLSDALALYTGDYLAEDKEVRWVLIERARLRERYFTAITRLMEWQGAAGLYNEAITSGHSALELDPCREPVYRLIMQFQAQLGDTAAALQTFENCRQALDTSLAADPSPQTLALHTAILRGEFPASLHPYKNNQPNGHRSFDNLPSTQELSFIGRDAEMPWLMTTLSMIVTRSIMGYLSEALEMGRVLMKRLQQARTREDLSANTQEVLHILVDMMRRWAHLLTVDDSLDAHAHLHSSLLSALDLYTSPFAPYRPAPPPPVRDWDHTIEVLGDSQAALVLTSYGWALLLQGLNEDARQCLQAALKAAEATNQVAWWILASMHISRVYINAGQHELGIQEFEHCLQRCQHVPAATWTRIWPQLQQGYFFIASGKIALAERAFSAVQNQLTSQDFPTYHHSLQIGFGLIAFHHQQCDLASALLQNALSQKPGVYIEVYILAELALADIAYQRGNHDHAFARLHQTLTFCQQRHLFPFYAMSAFALARHSIDAQRTHGIPSLLKDIAHHASRSGYPGIVTTCHNLLDQCVQFENAQKE